ncbi:hypothetical protein HID58_015911, partial [Brassica napus]
MGASINVHRQNIFKHLPITRSNPNFHFSDSPIAIRFTNKTVFAELSEMDNPIPLTAYNEESQSTQRLMITIIIEGTSLSNATSATHFYFDNECAAGQSYLERLKRMTLGELNDYMLKSQPQHGFSSFSCAPSNEENAISYQVYVAQDFQDWDLPQCLQEIVGSTLNFQLSLSHFNFSPYIRVSLFPAFFHNNQCPLQLNFEVNGGNEMPQACSLEQSRES